MYGMHYNLSFGMTSLHTMGMQGIWYVFYTTILIVYVVDTSIATFNFCIYVYTQAEF